jgi:hypothetical protein
MLFIQMHMVQDRSFIYIGKKTVLLILLFAKNSIKNHGHMYLQWPLIILRI